MSIVRTQKVTLGGLSEFHFYQGDQRERVRTCLARLIMQSFFKNGVNWPDFGIVRDW